MMIQCKNMLVILRKLLVAENELSRGTHCRDRLLELEGLAKELKISKCAGGCKDTYEWAEALGVLLVRGRKKMGVKDMQKFGQQLRVLRKQLESLDLNRVDKTSKQKAVAQRAFNEQGRQSMHSLLEPYFNVLEVYKQLLLLEDHLADKQLRCPTCIIKHTLFMEALTEEALGLDVTTKFVLPVRCILRNVQRIRQIYATKKRQGYCEMIRLVRLAMDKCTGLLNGLSASEKRKIHYA